MRISDWSSDVCSSDLYDERRKWWQPDPLPHALGRRRRSEKILSVQSVIRLSPLSCLRDVPSSFGAPAYNCGRNTADWIAMSVFDFRAARGVRPDALQRALGGDYIEFDEILASGGELALDEDDAG